MQAEILKNELFASLHHVYQRSTQHLISERYADAGGLAKDIRNWIVGNEKRTQSFTFIEEAKIFKRCRSEVIGDI